MAPVAAHLGLGVDPSELGPPLERMIELEWEEASKVQGKISGKVESVDSFGNLITNITRAQLADVPRDESVTIDCDGHETQGIFETYGQQPPMTLIALIGSSDMLEIAIVDDSAKIMLGSGVGAAVTVTW
jgi:S-adenosylmethionine hydrolase